MASNLFDPPPTYVLPVARGGDIDFTLTNKVDGVATPYPSTVTLTVVIDRKNDTVTVTAPISGSVASVRIQSEVADSLVGYELWRVIRHDTSATPTADLVVCNGYVQRFDGAAQ